MELIGHSVWNHTVLVLITRKKEEDSQTQPVDQHTIQWLQKKCGNRWFVFNKKKETEAAQVMKNLVKTAERVAVQYDGIQNPVNGQQCEHKRELQRLVEEIKKLVQKGKEKIKESSSSEAGNPPKASIHEDLYRQICAAETEEEEMTIFYRALSSGSKEFFKLWQNKPEIEKLGAQFVEEHRAELIKKVTSPQIIADALHDKNMVTKDLYSQITAAVTSQEKMRLLSKALNSAAKIRATFFKLLLENEPYLLEDLAQTQLEEE
ncbi:hypothetical protein AGOR_G00032660 [Albula goreensis]|uniref:CARD domain-containing protein n=1 Tax=Albula goreensis TaxID=1534307 RepID=A0A8T3E0Y8_9TELE|nr:hypothetical protein AGOR_G00032660 [Albula goreensis]